MPRTIAFGKSEPLDLRDVFLNLSAAEQMSLPVLFRVFMDLMDGETTQSNRFCHADLYKMLLHAILDSKCAATTRVLLVEDHRVPSMRSGVNILYSLVDTLE